MKKKLFTGLVVLASMLGNTSFAQDIYKTAANVPMVQLNKEEHAFNMSLEEKKRAYLGNMQIPTNK